MRLKNQLFSKYGLSCSPRRESPRRHDIVGQGIQSEELFMAEI
jgi:hypothetical protein